MRRAGVAGSPCRWRRTCVFFKQKVQQCLTPTVVGVDVERLARLTRECKVSGERLREALVDVSWSRLQEVEKPGPVRSFLFSVSPSDCLLAGSPQVSLPRGVGARWLGSRKRAAMFSHDFQYKLPLLTR